MLAEDQDFCSGGELADTPGDFDSVELRKADIEKEQVRPMALHLFERVQSIRRLIDYLEPGYTFQRRTDESPEGFIVINNKYFEIWHELPRFLNLLPGVKANQALESSISG